jgi:hypothetical protein
LSKAEHERFLQLFERSGKKSYAAFIADCVLNYEPKIIEINKPAIDYAILLSKFSGEFRRIGANYNQVLKALKSNFEERTAMKLLYHLEKATIELVRSSILITEMITKLRAQIFKNLPLQGD